VERVTALLRTLKALVRDPWIPRPIRWLLVVGLLPIPGPFDEAVLLVALGLIAVFCRPVYRQIKAEAATQPEAPPTSRAPVGGQRETLTWSLIARPLA
jgi:hypothetical protein